MPNKGFLNLQWQIVAEAIQGGRAEFLPALVLAASEPDNAETDMARGASGEETQRSASCNRQGRLGLVPCVRSGITQPLHAHHGKCRHLHEQAGSATKRAYFSFAGAGGKGAIIFVERQGYTPLGGVWVFITDKT